MSRRIPRAQKVNIFLVILLAALFLCPIYIAVVTSFKNNAEISQSVFHLPEKISFDNYKQAIEKSNFMRSMRNSCLVTFPSVILIVLCGSMGGYSICRKYQTSRVFRLIDRLYIASFMIPFQSMMIPVYKIFKVLKLQNSLLGMVLLLTGTSIAYSTFLYFGFAKSIPREIEEAALIDGASQYTVFFKIIFPLLKPVTATVAALHVMWLWNDFNIALIVLQKEEVRTLTVKQFYFFGQYATEYGMAFASAIMCMLPVLLFFILAQNYLVEGISSGAVKS